MISRINNNPYKVVFIYILFGLVWIFFSDLFIESLSNNTHTLSILQSFKGFVFIGSTSILLVLLITDYYKKIAESINQYELIFTANPNPMWICDINTYYFLSVNLAAIEKYEYSKEEFLSMKITDIRPKDDELKLRELLSNMDPNEHHFGIWKHQKKTGEILIMEVMSFPLTYDNKKCRLAFAKDITDKIHAEFKLGQANFELKEKIKQIRSYSFANSHKVRAPLANLIGLIDLLEKQDETASKAEIIEMLKSSAYTLDREVKIMNDILKD